MAQPPIRTDGEKKRKNAKNGKGNSRIDCMAYNPTYYVSRECLNHEPEKHNKVGESPRGSALCGVGSYFLDHIGRKVIILVPESIIIQLIVNGRLPALGRDLKGEIQQKDGNSKMDRKAHTSLYQDDAIIIHPHNAHLGGR